MPVGFKALADRYDIALAQPLRVESEIGTARLSRESDGNVENRYPPSYRPEDDFAGHFEFGLKYEEIHLEFFCSPVCGDRPATYRRLVSTRAFRPVRTAHRVPLRMADRGTSGCA